MAQWRTWHSGFSLNLDQNSNRFSLFWVYFKNKIIVRIENCVTKYLEGFCFINPYSLRVSFSITLWTSVQNWSHFMLLFSEIIKYSIVFFFQKKHMEAIKIVHFVKVIVCLLHSLFLRDVIEYLAFFKEMCIQIWN